MCHRVRPRERAVVHANPVEEPFELGQIGSAPRAHHEGAVRRIGLEFRFPLHGEPPIHPHAEPVPVKGRDHVVPFPQLELAAHAVAAAPDIEEGELGVVVGHHIGGEPLAQQHGFPVRLAGRLEPGLEGERAAQAHLAARRSDEAVVDAVEAQHEAVPLADPDRAVERGVVAATGGVMGHLPLAFIKIPTGQRVRCPSDPDHAACPQHPEAPTCTRLHGILMAMITWMVRLVSPGRCRGPGTPASP